MNYLYPRYHEIKHTNGMFDRAEKKNTTIKPELFQLNKFHIRALKGYFNSRNKTNKCQCVKNVYHISFITNMFATNIRVTCKNIRNPNSPSKCTSEPLDGTNNVSNCLNIQRISANLLRTTKIRCNSVC
jgi:hypothetical protein